MGPGLAIFVAILTAASLVISIANTVWMWLSRGGAANAAKFKAIESKLTNLDRRVQSVEGELKHLPTREDLHKLSEQLTRVSTELEAFSRELRAVDRAVNRIEESLLESRK